MAEWAALQLPGALLSELSAVRKSNQRMEARQGKSFYELEILISFIHLSICVFWDGVFQHLKQPRRDVLVLSNCFCQSANMFLSLVLLSLQVSF